MQYQIYVNDTDITKNRKTVERILRSTDQASAPQLVYYPFCGMVHISDPSLVIKNSIPCDSYLNGLLPYV